MKALAWLRPEERIALAFFAGVATLFIVRQYPFTVGSLVASYLQFLLAISVFVLPPWMVVSLVRRLRGRLPPRTFVPELLVYLRSLAALLVALVAYTNLKCRLLLYHPQLFDRIFWQLDDTLHMGGGDLVAWVTSLHSPPRTVILQNIYFYAWAALALPLAVAMARSGVTLVRRALAALALCYIGGVFAYLALPSLGPALVESGRYAALSGSHAFALQQSMLAALRYTVQNSGTGRAVLRAAASEPAPRPPRSVSSSPGGPGARCSSRSCRGISRSRGAAYFGWHYLIDITPAWGSPRLQAAGRLLRRQGKESVLPSSRTAATATNSSLTAISGDRPTTRLRESQPRWRPSRS
jgi:hypothetical protein